MATSDQPRRPHSRRGLTFVVLSIVAMAIAVAALAGLYIQQATQQDAIDTRVTVAQQKFCDLLGVYVHTPYPIKQTATPIQKLVLQKTRELYAELGCKP